MATVIITMSDCDDGQVDISLEFGDTGAQDDSLAHLLGVTAVEKAVELLKGEG